MWMHLNFKMESCYNVEYDRTEDKRRISNSFTCCAIITVTLFLIACTLLYMIYFRPYLLPRCCNLPDQLINSVNSSDASIVLSDAPTSS